jgi:hypothetical protein
MRVLLASSPIAGHVNPLVVLGRIRHRQVNELGWQKAVDLVISGHDHRQADELWLGQAGDHAWGRASSAQGASTTAEAVLTCADIIGLAIAA